MQFLEAIFYASASLWFCTQFGALVSKANRDDTDGSKGQRSGLILYTDYGTGVQYLGTTMGGLIRRCQTPEGVTLHKTFEASRTQYK